MKARESGMPDESTWTSFFSPAETLARLGLTQSCGNAVDFGCGYGTFALPAARIVRGTVYAFDIELDMVRATAQRANAEGLSNVRVEQRDFLIEGTRLAGERVDFVMLLNILHCEQPLDLLKEAWRVLSPGGVLGIMHWNYDSSTPRGPSMSTRPKPEQCLAWAEAVGFRPREPGAMDLPPFHYGWSFWKRSG